MNDDNGPRDFGGNINFNAQHAPTGAFASFTCGHFGTRGGFGLQIGKPGNQDLYIGIKDGDRYDATAPIRCLPFFRQANASGGTEFLVEQAAGPSEANAQSVVGTYAKDQISRRYGWATDAWQTDDFSFAIYTPFGAIPDPSTATRDELRRALLPAVVAELTVDNTRGTHAKCGFFAMNWNSPGWVPTDDGFALRAQCGVRGEVLDADRRRVASPDLFARWTLDGGLLERVPHRLGACPGLAFDVPAGERRTLRLALGSYLAGVVTTGVETSYLYTRVFAGLPDVLAHALTNAADALEVARACDRRLLDSGLSADRQFLIAHATRSYYGSTQLLVDAAAGEPLWVVNEGEYCMMNTLDLAVDQVFWELRHNPWVVRNLLDRFVSRYAYLDQVRRADGTLAPGGIAFAHDMGVHNNLSPPGHSSYELPELTGCFSYMTAEQLCNWSLTAATYACHTGDLDWARANQHVIAACVASLVNRGGADGSVQFDSSRCGERGAEITTYDSLDHSLAQTRNNVYIAVKCWATYLGLAVVSDALGDAATARTARAQMERVAASVIAQAGPDGVIPAVFEPDNPGHASRILPACEGLVYAIQWQRTRLAAARVGEWIAAPASAALVAALERHTRALLLDDRRRNVFDDGGIKLSSTSNNSWMSKIALLQHVARERFDAREDAGLARVMNAADAAHVRWQTDGSGYWACCDQIVSGEAKGSRYYPRIISASLWLDEPRRDAFKPSESRSHEVSSHV